MDPLSRFKPYTTREMAEEISGIDWPFSWSAVGVREDRSFLVFLDEDQVAAAFDHPVRKGDGLDDTCYSRDEATFIVTEPRFDSGREPPRLSHHPRAEHDPDSAL